MSAQWVLVAVAQKGPLVGPPEVGGGVSMGKAGPAVHCVEGRLLHRAPPAPQPSRQPGGAPSSPSWPKPTPGTCGGCCCAQEASVALFLTVFSFTG